MSQGDRRRSSNAAWIDFGRLGSQPWRHGCIQLALLLSLGCWIAVDPAFPLGVASNPGGIGSSISIKRVLLLTIMVVVVGDLLFLMICLFVGPKPFHNLQSLMLMVTLIGLWLALAAGRNELAWHGKRCRLGWQLNRFDSLAETLRENWPTEDGERSALGPFMAYPFGRPQTLVLLTPPQVDSMGTVISVIERRGSGSLLFQLAGAEQASGSQRDWIEWHPHGRPNSFVGGLNDPHKLERSTQLDRGWHLARYAS